MIVRDPIAPASDICWRGWRPRNSGGAPRIYIEFNQLGLAVQSSSVMTPHALLIIAPIEAKHGGKRRVAAEVA